MSGHCQVSSRSIDRLLDQGSATMTNGSLFSFVAEPNKSGDILWRSIDNDSGDVLTEDGETESDG